MEEFVNGVSFLIFFQFFASGKKGCGFGSKFREFCVKRTCLVFWEKGEKDLFVRFLFGRGWPACILFCLVSTQHVVCH